MTTWNRRCAEKDAACCLSLETRWIVVNSLDQVPSPNEFRGGEGRGGRGREREGEGEGGREVSTCEICNS